MRPFLAPTPLDLSKVYILVRASFFLADGTNHKGYIKPKPVDRVDVGNFMSAIIPYDLSPIIVLGKEHIHFQYGPDKPDPEEMQRVYSLFSKKSHEVFSIRFSSDVEVLDSVHEGKLDGFMYFDQYQGDFDHTLSLKSTDIKYAK